MIIYANFRADAQPWYDHMFGHVMRDYAGRWWHICREYKTLVARLRNKRYLAGAEIVGC